MRLKEIQIYKSEHMENVAAVLLYYDGLGTNDEILQALKSKYDALKDKLLLEALRKQLGKITEWFSIRFINNLADRTVTTRPGTSYQVEIHSSRFNHLYLLFSLMKFV